MEIIKVLSSELSIPEEKARAAISLLDEGNTIPFIARYRKEVTGEMDDVTLRNLSERYEYLKGLEERKKSVLSSISEQGKLTPELELAIENAQKLTEVDNLYRPYKKKRKTRGSMAIEAGLAPLEKYLLAQNGSLASLYSEADKYINEEKGIPDRDAALKGAYDILAEEMSDVASFYDFAKSYIIRSGRLTSKQTKEDVENKYQTYASFSSFVKGIKNYQTLAISRGEKEKCLSVSFAYDHMTIINEIARKYLLRNSPYEKEIRSVCEDSYKRLIAPAVENEIRNDLFAKAEDASIIIFKDNLKQLLLSAPLKGKRVLGFDPAFINGCKLASVDSSGKLLHVGVIYPTIGGKEKKEESEKLLLSFIKNDKIDYIALGNGTASRESEAFINDVIKRNGLEVKLFIVNEAGASVYSASVLGGEEFPSLSVEKRSAISLARRLQDPLAELVKIDPYSLGVGQYQHDLDQKKLSSALHGVVEDAVNEVGVYLNNASSALLSYISGIGPSLAKTIEKYRDENGPFKSREELRKVPKLGPKAYEQCAGFLRIIDSNPLDNTSVHPESYKTSIALLAKLGFSLSQLNSEEAKSSLSNIKDYHSLAIELNVGEPTLKDIVQELIKPGRDIRLEAASATLSQEVTDMKELKVGQVLMGTVRNIVDFGAFVDIGVHQDGLVHISELSDKPVSSPLEVVHVNEIVKVKVISIDLPRKRIGLSIKQANVANPN